MIFSFLKRFAKTAKKTLKNKPKNRKIESQKPQNHKAKNPQSQKSENRKTKKHFKNRILAQNKRKKHRKMLWAQFAAVHIA